MFGVSLEDHRFGIYETRTSSALWISPPHSTNYRIIGFSPDETLVITKTANGIAQVWDMKTMKQVVEPVVHSAFVGNALHFFSGNHSIVTHDQSYSTSSREVTTGILRVWSLIRNRNSTTMMDGPPFKHVQVIPAKDGRTAVVTPQERLVILDPGTGKLVDISSEDETRPLQCKFSLDGERIGIRYAKTAYLKDSRTGDLVDMVSFHASPRNIAINDSGSLMATVAANRSGDRRVVLRDTINKARILFSESKSRVLSLIGFRPGIDQLLLREDESITLWNLTNHGQLSETWSVKVDNSFQQGQFSPDGSHILFLNNAGLALLDGETGETEWTFEYHSSFLGARFSNDGRLLLAYGPSVDTVVTTKGFVVVMDVDTGRPVAELNQLGQLTDAVFTNNGKAVATADKNLEIKVWDTETEAVIAGPIEFKAGIRFLHSGNDGRLHIASGGRFHQWELPFFDEPAPEWLPDLAEMVARQKLDKTERPVDIDEKEVQAFLSGLDKLNGDSRYEQFARWLNSMNNPTLRQSFLSPQRHE